MEKELPKENPNLAPRYKEVTSTAEDTWGLSNLGKEQAVNGKIQNVETGYGWVSKPIVDNEPQWLQLEYESPITVKKYVIYHDGAIRPAEAKCNSQDFQLQYSDDGTNWEVADDVTAEAIAEGEAVMENENATRNEVLKASLKLMKAIQALDMKAGDKTDLGMALELTNMIDLAQYVEAGQAEYLATKAEAERVMQDGDAMQPEVDAAWAELVDRMMDLRLKADKSTLSDLLDSVKDLDLNKYTDDTVAVYKDALAAAMAIMEDDTLSEDDQTKWMKQ